MGILCNKSMPSKLQSKVCKITIRPATVYGSEFWPIRARELLLLHAAEMRMIRGTLG